MDSPLKSPQVRLTTHTTYVYQMRNLTMHKWKGERWTEALKS
jgi:hypothetical protein